MERLVILKNPVPVLGRRTVNMIVAVGRFALLRRTSASMLLATFR
jgi:hypothetical protein